MSLTQERLRELTDYNPQTGAMTWKRDKGRALAGSSVGTKGSWGYWSTKIDGQAYKVHRLIWFYVHGFWPSGDIDHIDGDKSNHRLANLREATRSQNNWNVGLRSNTNTGLKGVGRHKGAYRARIQAFGKQKFLGRFETAEAAHAAYCAAAREYHGDFARF